jgi:hypothetical protein
MPGLQALIVCGITAPQALAACAMLRSVHVEGAKKGSRRSLDLHTVAARNALTDWRA